MLVDQLSFYLFIDNNIFINVDDIIIQSIFSLSIIVVSHGFVGTESPPTPTPSTISAIAPNISWLDIRKYQKTNKMDHVEFDELYSSQFHCESECARVMNNWSTRAKDNKKLFEIISNGLTLNILL